jgi:nucleotide-binding universal stress UspA family protein
MSGIIVGVDGSAHSGCALEWAMNEAVLRRAPLTVVTVYPVIVGYLGNTVGYPEDQARAERAPHGGTGGNSFGWSNHWA